MRKISEDFSNETKEVDQFHSEMCKKTGSFQAEWVSSLDSAIEQMNSIKTDFYSHLHEWQEGLYKVSLKPLANNFVELYKIINVDKLIRAETLFEYSQQKKLDSANKICENNVSDNIEVSDSECSGTTKSMLQDNANEKSISCSDAVMSSLEKLDKSLNIFLRRFESSLKGMDMYVYYPDKGEIFDDTKHVVNDDCEGYSGKRIVECVVPGIVKKINNGFDEDIIVKAVVKVEMENEQ